MKDRQALRHYGVMGAALVVVVAVVCGATYQRRRPSVTAEPMSSPPNTITEAILRRYHLTEHSEDRFATRGTYVNGPQVLQTETVSDLDAESAETLIEEGILGIQALYANALSAYPENLSQQVATPERFRPKLFRKQSEGILYSYFLLHATDRFAYGAASDDTVKLRSLLGWIYCAPRRVLYKIRMFAPLNTPTPELEEFFLALRCG